MANDTKPVEFEGRSSEMRVSPWLSAEDLLGIVGEIEVKIEKVIEHHNVEFEAGRKKDKCYALQFVGGRRQLILNATNRKALVNAFGVNVSDWKGKTVKVFTTTTKLKGETVPCVRIKV